MASSSSGSAGRRPPRPPRARTRGRRPARPAAGRPARRSTSYNATIPPLARACFSSVIGNEKPSSVPTMKASMRSRSSTGIPRKVQIENSGTSWPSCGCTSMAPPSALTQAVHQLGGEPVSAVAPRDTWRGENARPTRARRRVWASPSCALSDSAPPAPERPVGHAETVEGVDPERHEVGARRHLLHVGRRQRHQLAGVRARHPVLAARRVEVRVRVLPEGRVPQRQDGRCPGRRGVATRPAPQRPR